MNDAPFANCCAEIKTNAKPSNGNELQNLHLEKI